MCIENDRLRVGATCDLLREFLWSQNFRVWDIKREGGKGARTYYLHCSLAKICCSLAFSDGVVDKFGAGVVSLRGGDFSKMEQKGSCSRLQLVK